MRNDDRKNAIINRPSAVDEDADQHRLGDAAAQAEADRIDAWTNPKFAGGGRHQLQRDSSFGRPEKRTGK
jgi:hypothetical protein